MNQPAAPDTGTHLFFLDNEAVLFSERRQELHSFNTTAAVIWCLMERGHKAQDIAMDLARRFAVGPDQASTYVASALQDWAARGLLSGTDGPPQTPPPPGWHPRPGLPPFPSAPRPAAVHRIYRLSAMRFTLQFATASQFHLLHPVLAHLEDHGDADTVFDLIEAGDATILHVDHQPIDACTEHDRLVPMVYLSLWMLALRRGEFALNIHAGVLRSGTDCLLLPAPPGSGKSVLTAALIHGGFDYFSDEVALLSAEDLAVTPFPQAICLKDSGLAPVARFRPEVRDVQLHWRADGRRVAYLPPPPERLPPPHARGAVRAVIFPRFVAGSARHCTEIPKLTALQRLLSQCLVIEHRLDAVLVGRLVRWIDGLVCRELVYGETTDGVAAVEDVMAEVRSTQRTRKTQTRK